MSNTDKANTKTAKPDAEDKKPKQKAAATPAPYPKPEKALKGSQNQSNIAISDISVRKGFNPRTELGEIDELKASIREYGIISPISVVPTKPGSTKYYLIAGHRRFTAASELKLAAIPAVVRDIDINSPEALGFALSENSPDAREALNPVDEAAAFARMLEAYGGPGNEGRVAHAAGYSKKHVERALRINDAPKSVKERVRAGTLSKMGAVALTEAPASVQERVLSRIPESGASERDVRVLVKEAQQEAKKSGDESALKKGSDGNAKKARILPGNQEGMVNIPPVGRHAATDMRSRLARLYNNVCADFEESTDPKEKGRLVIERARVEGAISALLWQASITTQLITDSDNPALLVDADTVKRLVDAVLEDSKAEEEAAAKVEAEAEEEAPVKSKKARKAAQAEADE